MRGTLGARRINSPLQVKSRFSHADGATPPLLPCVAVSPDLASRHKWRGLRSGRGELIRLAQDFHPPPRLPKRPELRRVGQAGTTRRTRPLVARPLNAHIQMK